MMTILHFIRAAFLTFFILMAMGFNNITEAQLRAGVGKTDITPPLGTPLRGYYYERLASNVHDPLFARALVIKDGKNTLVLVIVDNVDGCHCSSSEAKVSRARSYAGPTRIRILLPCFFSATS